MLEEASLRLKRMDSSDMTPGVSRVEKEFGYVRDRPKSWAGRDCCGPAISFNVSLPNEEEMWTN